MAQAAADVAETSGAEEELSDAECDLIGSMRTTATWDASSRQLSVECRQLVESFRKIELKYKGYLNTSTGDYSMRGYLRKNLYSNKPSMQRVYTAAQLQQLRQRLNDKPLDDRSTREQIRAVNKELRELSIDPDRLLPAGWRPLLLTDWCISPGTTYCSAAPPGSGWRAALFVKKAPQVIIHSPRTDLLITAKAVAEVDPRTTEAKVKAGLRLKLLKYNVTSRQDLKVSVGLDLATFPLEVNKGPAGPAPALYQASYLKISENNTSIKLQGGKWSFQYEL